MPAIEPGFFTTESMPAFAVMMMFTEPANIGSKPSVRRMAPKFTRTLPPSAEDMKNGGSVTNNRSMLAERIDGDQMGFLETIGTV